VTSPISSVATSIYTTNSSGSAPSTSGANLDENAFLKLLVAQLKYQDPSKPADSTQFMAQTAAFTQVEKLTALLTSQQTAAADAAKQTATAMVGRTVSYTTAAGTTASGMVASASFTGSEPTLRVGDTDVALSSVTEVLNSAG
jgi:flagellar basal-body rod modification protein FlgD